MKEDLDLYQNQYNYIVVSWTIGYIIGQLVRGIPNSPFARHQVLTQSRI